MTAAGFIHTYTAVWACMHVVALGCMDIPVVHASQHALSSSRPLHTSLSTALTITQAPGAEEWRYSGGSCFNDAVPSTFRYSDVARKLNDKFSDTVSFKVSGSTA